MNFSDIGKLAGLFQQAQQARERITEIEKQLAQKLISAEAGGGLVKVTATAAGVIQKIEIDQELMADQDTDLLSDLLVSATNQVLTTSKSAVKTEMESLLGGFDLPGFLKP